MKALSLSCLLCLLLVATVAAEPAPVAPAPPRLDDFGDALPPNAVARIGSTRLRHGGKVFALSFSPDCTQLFSAGEDQMVRIWDTATGKELNSVFIKNLYAVEFAPDGQTMAVSQSEGGQTLWSMTGQQLASLIAAGRDNHGDRVWYHADGKHLVTVCDGIVTFWDLAGPRKIHTFEAMGKVWTQAWGDGKHLAARQDNGEIQLWDVATRKQAARLQEKLDVFGICTLSPDGRYAVIGGTSLMEVKTKELIFHLPDFDSACTFAPNGRILAGSSLSSKTVRLWDLTSGRKLLWELKTPEGFQGVLAFSRDSNLLVTGSYTGAIRIWDIRTGKEAVPLPGREAGSLVGPANGGRTIVVQNHGHLRSWDLEIRDKSEHIRFPRERPRRVEGVDNTLALSKDGRIALVVNSHRGLFLMDLSRDKELHMLHETEMGDNFWGCDAALSPDGKTVACATSTDGDSIVVWDVTTGKMKWEQPGTQNNCTIALAFSQDSKTLVSVGSGDGHQVRFLDAATGKELHQGQTPGGRHYERPRRIPAYSPRGTVLGIFTRQGPAALGPRRPLRGADLAWRRGVRVFARWAGPGNGGARVGRCHDPAVGSRHRQAVRRAARLAEPGQALDFHAGWPGAGHRQRRRHRPGLGHPPAKRGYRRRQIEAQWGCTDTRLGRPGGIGRHGRAPGDGALPALSRRQLAVLAPAISPDRHAARGASRLCSASWTPMHLRTAKRRTRNCRSSTGLWNPTCARPCAKSRTSTYSVTWNDSWRIWRARTWASRRATACGRCARSGCWKPCRGQTPGSTWKSSRQAPRRQPRPRPPGPRWSD